MIYTDNTHLVADSLPELHAFARQMELHKCYFGGIRKRHPHYDLLNSKNQPLYDKAGKKMMDKAIEMGAILSRPRVVLAKSKALAKTDRKGQYYLHD